MRLYLKYFEIHLKSQMQYKLSFFFTLLGQFLTSFSMFLSIYFLMRRVNAVEGFTYDEVLLCFATVLLAFALAECFARGFDSFSGTISGGEFDRILVRPRNEVFQVLASKIEFSRLGRLIQAAVVFAYAIPHSSIHWSPDKIITLILMITCGTVTFAGLFVVYASLCFFTTEGLEFMNIFTDGGREFGSYPFAIYGKTVLRFFTFVVPLALFQYYPMLYLTERNSDPRLILLPLLSLLFLIPCAILWKIGVHRYRSTGS